MKKYIYILLFCFCGKVGAQTNLVPNSSFEVYAPCPTTSGQIYCAPPWFQPCILNGNTTNSSSSELINACNGSTWVGVPTNNAGYQYARTGNGYAGFCPKWNIPNYREYIEVSLISPLVYNKNYCVEFYVSLCEVAKISISNLGAYFSVDSLLDTTNYQAINYVIPQLENVSTNILSDTANWILVSGNFIANGGEKFLTIGNFHNDATTNSNYNSYGTVQMAYYYIDDVSVIELDSLHTECTLSGISEISFPQQTISISPNPFTSQTTITFSEQQKNTTIKITDLLGKEIKTINFTGRQLTIEKAEITAGIYFVQTTDEKKHIINKKIIIQ